MDNTTLVKAWKRMGATLVIEGPTPKFPQFAIDVRGDKFIMNREPKVEVNVVNVVPEQRHLLVKAVINRSTMTILAGHDERAWFVAGVDRQCATVEQAIDSLRPNFLRRNKDAFSRKAKGWVRQGEFFFVPAPNFNPAPADILRNEPISAGGREHFCQELVRFGGRLVWLSQLDGSVINDAAYLVLPNERRSQYVMRREDAKVYVRGKITHPAGDHKPLNLNGWHEVVPNTQTSIGGGIIRFLD